MNEYDSVTIEETKYNIETLQAMEDIKNEKNLSRKYTNLDEMWKSIEGEYEKK